VSAETRAITAGLKAGLRYRGQLISYRRGAALKSVTAMRGRTLQEQAGAVYGTAYATASAELTDWVFQVSSLTGWESATPAAGDTITAGGVTYLVTAAEDGRAWRYVDPSETWVRVHTVRTSQ
jgi:hypothetical protein